MRFREHLEEAIKLSQAKPYMVYFDRNRYDQIFGKKEDGKPKYRVYLDINETPKEKKVTPVFGMIGYLRRKGYVLDDYVKGIAVSEDGKRKIKIGKLIKDEPDLKKKFDNDPKRAASKQSKHLVVISRHPYDIAGMSTGRGWTSCMNIKTGSYKQYVMTDVKEGTIIAYVIKPNDKNINKPVARMSIKPFINVADNKDILLVPEGETYGTQVKGFEKTIQKWLDSVQPDKKGVYSKSECLYTDSSKDRVFKDVNQETENLYNDPDSIADIVNSTEEQQLIAIEFGNFKTISLIKNPNKKVKLAAIKKTYLALKYIKNPTEEMKLEGVNNYPYLILEFDYPSDKLLIAVARLQPDLITTSFPDSSERVMKEVLKARPDLIHQLPSASEKLQIVAINNQVFGKDERIYDRDFIIKHLRNPSEAVQLASVKKYPDSIGQMKYPSERVQLTALRAEGGFWSFHLIKNPTEKAKRLGIELGYENIEDIDDPSEELQLLALDINPDARYFIKNPSPKAQLKLIELNPFYIDEIDNPDEKTQLVAIEKRLEVYDFINNPTKKATELYNKLSGSNV